MEPSLTILLPVRNAQSSLHSMVAEVLDIAMEADAPFELVIIDDGSSDATGEVVHEVARRYPQIRVVSHREPLGVEAAIQTGLRQSRAETVFLPDISHGISLNQVPRMWRSADRREWSCDKHSALKMPAAASAPAASRAAPESPQGSPSRPGRPNFLVRLKQLAFDE